MDLSKKFQFKAATDTHIQDNIESDNSLNTKLTNSDVEILVKEKTMFSQNTSPDTYTVSKPNKNPFLNTSNQINHVPSLELSKKNRILLPQLKDLIKSPNEGVNLSLQEKSTNKDMLSVDTRKLLSKNEIPSKFTKDSNNSMLIQNILPLENSLKNLCTIPVRIIFKLLHVYKIYFKQ